jgi:hypothetical protein
LLLRFFARAMMSYNNLERYNEIRTLAWQFLGGRSEWIDFSTNYYVYEIQWKSPKPLRQLVWAIMTYGFFWLFAVFATATAWGFYSTTGGCTARLFAGGVLLLGVVWETQVLWTSPIYSFSAPTNDDLSKARRDSEFSLMAPKEKTELRVGGYAMVAAVDYVQYGQLGIVQEEGSDVGLSYADDPDVYVFPRCDVVAVADPFK